MTYRELYDQSLRHPDEFWREQAQSIHWFTEPQKVLSQDEEGLDRWYRGGQLNTCYLTLDYHLEHGRGEQAAHRQRAQHPSSVFQGVAVRHAKHLA